MLEHEVWNAEMEKACMFDICIVACNPCERLFYSCMHCVKRSRVCVYALYPWLQTYSNSVLFEVLCFRFKIRRFNFKVERCNSFPAACK